MVDIRRSVRRVTVIDGVDVADTFSIPPVRDVIGARLIVVSVGQNSVTYDVEILYLDSGSSVLSFNIFSNQISDGADIQDESLGDFGNTDTGRMDLHTRYVANNKLVTNLLVSTSV